MLLRDLRKVYISTYEEIEDHGETTKKWKFKKEIQTVAEVDEMQVKDLDKLEIRQLATKNNDGIAFLNLQDRKSTRLNSSH